MEDTIIVSQIEVRAHVGVAPAERGAAQRLTVSLKMMPARGVGGLVDEIANTVDYAAVCADVRHEAESKPRKLLETLAEEIASMLMGRYPLRAVEIEVRKYIIPGTEYVAVSFRRGREA